MPTDLSIHPLAADRWADFELLFGPKGARDNCWCMYWRLTGSAFARNGNAGNRAAMQDLVREGKPLGLLAYAEGRPVGWIAVAPRAATPRLRRSPLLKPVDDVDVGDADVWAITCLFVHRDWRGRHLMRKLIDAAVDHARQAGAAAVEAFPDWKGGRPPGSGWEQPYMGSLAAYRDAGFVEVARRKPHRPILRRTFDAAAC